MNGNRGRIANPGLEGQRVRGVYFFAGNWRFALPGQKVPQFYELPVTENASLYTIHPTDARHLGWSENVANQEFALDSMVEAGANTVIMSYWGQPGTDRWPLWAPMQTATQAHTELFQVAATRPLLIMPAIESSAAALDCGGLSLGFEFASDFPGSQVDPSPELVKQCVDLIERYLHNSAHPEWAKSWLQLFDRNGDPRYAINILHVSSNQIAATRDDIFAAGFNWVADLLLQRTGVKVGFTLDILNQPQKPIPAKLADCRGWMPWFAIHSETTTHAGGSVTALWASESHLDLFIIGTQGTLQSIWWDKSEPAGYRPQGWFAIHPEQAFPPGAPVTAVWASKDHLDLFAVDLRGTVQSIWWDRSEPAGYRPQGWFAIHPETRFPPATPLTAVWANQNHLDLFAADSSGVVQTISSDQNEPSRYRTQGWLAIHPETRTASGGRVTAQWSNINHLDLYIASTDRAVSSIWWDRNEPAGYRPQGWFAIGTERRFQPGAGVVALWAPGPAKNHLDLFVIDEQGTVFSNWWDVNQPQGYRPEGWFAIGSGPLSRAGGNLGACWISNSELHLAMTARNGAVLGATWTANQVGGWSGWFPLRTEVVGVPGQAIVLLSREMSHADLFFADPGGVVKSTFRAAVSDTYVGLASRLGTFLEKTAPVIAIQGFIPEISAAGPDNNRLQVKRDYWKGWLSAGLPVFFDVCPGYDAHLAFPGTTPYGNNDLWRSALTKAWSSSFQGIVFNTWNGYTEGYAAMPTLEYRTANWDWIQKLFNLAKP
jgi:hypothetical protein